MKGFSLVELLLVIVMVGLTVLILANLPNSMILINKSKHISLAREIAAKQMEDKRAISYINLINGTTNITSATDSRISSLPNGNGTVVVEDCNVQICLSGEHIKQITVTVNWKDNSKDQTLSLKTLIGEGGLNQ